MNHSNYYISLDIRDSLGACCPQMKKGDTLRRLYIHLTDGGRPYPVPGDSFPVFTAKKPDGKVIFNPCTVENNAIIYEITPQTTTCTGLLQCEVRLYDRDPESAQAQLLTSARFGIRVHPTVYNEGDIPESSAEVAALTKLIGEAQQATEAAEAAAAAVPKLIDDTATSSEHTWSSQKVSNEFSSVKALMDAKDQLAAAEMEIKVEERLAKPFDVKASTVQLGAENANKVNMQAVTRDDDFGVVEFTPSMVFPFPERDKNRVILRNIAPGKEDNDAVTVKQLQDAISGMDVDVDFEGEEVLCESLMLMDEHGNPIGLSVDYDDCPALYLQGEADGEGGVPIVVRNVAAGRDPDDAVSFIQLMGVEGKVNINAQDIAELNRSVGDMETALDSIIAVQKELMGIIKFYIEGIEYQAEEGMTWEQWLNSEYNDDYESNYVDNAGYLRIADYFLSISDGSEEIHITQDMVIVPNGQYDFA